MLSLDRIRAATSEALEYVSTQPDVAAAEVFASADANLTVRLNYTSHIPSNGVEEPKSAESFGFGPAGSFPAPATDAPGNGGRAHRLWQRTQRPFARWRTEGVGQGPRRGPSPTRSLYRCPHPTI